MKQIILNTFTNLCVLVTTVQIELLTILWIALRKLRKQKYLEHLRASNGPHLMSMIDFAKLKIK